MHTHTHIHTHTQTNHLEAKTTYPLGNRLARISRQKEAVGIGTRRQKGLDEPLTAVLHFVYENCVDRERPCPSYVCVYVYTYVCVYVVCMYVCMYVCM